MTVTRLPIVLTCALPLAILPIPGWSQTPAAGGITACPSQGELEQTINSDAAIVPDDCTTLEVNSLRSENGELCLIDFGIDEGFLGRLRDVAFPSQWWMKCEDLAAALR